MSDEGRTQLLEKAKLAEQAERYDDMAKVAMKRDTFSPFKLYNTYEKYGLLLSVYTS